MASAAIETTLFRLGISANAMLDSSLTLGPNVIPSRDIYTLSGALLPTFARQRLDVDQAVRRYMGTILGVRNSLANAQPRPVETEGPTEASGNRRNSEFLSPAIQQRCTH